MGIFSRRKKDNETTKELVIPELPHTHLWKDFPWYMYVEYSEKSLQAEYSIIEPYVCISCGERKNITLEHRQWTGIDRETREKEYERVAKKYRKFLKPRAIVEDMINNVLLVKDPEHLDMVETLLGSPHRGCGTSAQMQPFKNEDKDQPTIEVPK